MISRNFQNKSSEEVSVEDEKAERSDGRDFNLTLSKLDFQNRKSV